MTEPLPYPPAERRRYEALHDFEALNDDQCAAVYKKGAQYLALYAAQFTIHPLTAGELPILDAHSFEGRSVTIGIGAGETTGWVSSKNKDVVLGTDNLWDCVGLCLVAKNDKGEILTNLFHFDTISDPKTEIDQAMQALKGKGYSVEATIFTYDNGDRVLQGGCAVAQSGIQSQSVS